ncbi:DNA/RNA non-specific endonuclease [Grimontia marina]|uniref:Nuclease n=1 Tax=Grimontia marina TaxID=646534 RepID=A0A128FKV4_9GAMM|nr:DNA/RNA non-specific endonuclease [Grimontia marina]CZF86904.1 Nuclease precursor [Grimontia marina]
MPSQGFNTEFLSVPVSLPRLGESLLEVAWEYGEPLHYEHFSLVMNRETKMAFYTAHNIDRQTLMSLKRARWKLDPRVDIDYQAGPEVYKNNVWDRGHMVRRAAITWGSRPEASQANRDSFFYTNANLQHAKFNQDEWLELENWLLEEEDLDDKLSVFTGPINTINDQPYRGTYIPSAFWKVIVFTKGGELQCRAFLMKQSEFWDDHDGRNTLNLESYQVSLTQITELTDLYFQQALYDTNPMFYSTNNFTTSNDIDTPEMRPIESPTDIVDNRGKYTDIVQELWDADDNRFDVTRLADGRWMNENADIRLYEQGYRRPGKRDLAKFFLFDEVNTDKLMFLPSYQAFKRLIDNYNELERDEEKYSDVELAEIEHFLDTCFARYDDEDRISLMESVYQYITDDQSEGGLGFAQAKLTEMPFTSTTFGEGQCIDLTSIETFRETVRNIWFGLYTNNFGNRQVKHASGFEHVFLGEIKREGSRYEIGGYHFWAKFFWDEQNGSGGKADLEYLGSFYDGPEGNLNTDVATLAMSWRVGEKIAWKEKGGFFVGMSPECLLALGTMLTFESFRNDTQPLSFFDGESKRRAAINGWRYDLVLYRETLKNQDRGFHLRSFYPVLKSRDNRDLLLAPHSNTDVLLYDEGDVVIASAMPNPPGVGDQNEWVSIRNETPGLIDVTGWQIRTKSGTTVLREKTKLPPGREHKIVVRAGGGGAALSNKGTVIELLDTEDTVISKVEYKSVSRRAEGQVLNFS